ncbi:nitrate reductase [Rhizobium sp. Root708]|uniref:periplasmic nitrate reductase, NapE protein n=1 Tax=Rhizobium sp. Root708 TaxID=1736592 RepID=UPI0006F6EAED|nr:periplasmic nitrate reductase, NapE protein [Rhizobium sp. Root708]KRB49170.1 nitrate reductase [Rhizobium sp. Root708]
MADLRNLEKDDKKLSRYGELLAFAVLAFGVWPILAVGTVASYGFIVWFYQIVFGPPGPPPTIH